MMKKVKKRLCLLVVFSLLFTSGIFSFAEDFAIAASDESAVNGSPQPMSFALPGTVQKTYGDPAFGNTAAHVGGSAGKGAITYSSSNTSVATVGQNSGSVTITGAGTAVITATAAEVPGVWAVSTVSYTLEVGKLTPATLNLRIDIPQDPFYNGYSHAASVTAGQSRTGLGTVTLLYNGKTAAPVNAGTYNVTANITAGKNYNAITGLHIGTINVHPGKSEGLHTILVLDTQHDRTFQYDLTYLLPPEVRADQITGYTCSTVIPGASIFSGQPTIRNSMITLPIRDFVNRFDYDTIYINYNSENYLIDESQFMVTTYDQTVVKIGGVTVASRPYNGSPVAFDASKITFTDSVTGTAIPGMIPVFEWSGGSAPVDAGSYTLTVSVSNPPASFVNEQVIRFNITKAPLTLRADSKAIDVNGALPPFTFSVDGLIAPDTWERVRTANPGVECPTSNIARSGSYPITIRGGFLNRSTGENYEIRNYADGSLTVGSGAPPPSGGGVGGGAPGGGGGAPGGSGSGGASSSEIVGVWAFDTGRGTYFFWRSDEIEFRADGTVHNHEDRTSGSWTISGNSMTVRADYGSTYVYEINISGNRLSITDSDRDTGQFVRIR